ncbi:hypothetical protein HOI18_02685, partial [Candidatus Uhrbacteria bacterium]|nr:hypothetical protein [Candidatus Uhrbacteria bacterium]
MVFYISPVQAADITCPATDDGTGYDSGASGDGEITINANATWTMPSGAVGDVWDCSLLDIVVTNNSTLTLVGSTTSGAYPYLQVIDLTVDSGSSISGDAKGCTTNGTGYGSMHPNTSTNVCTDTTDTTTQGGGAGTQGGASVGGGGGANGGSGGRSENNANPDLLGGTRYGSAYFTAPLYGSTGGEGDGQLGGKGGGVIRLEMSGTFTHNGVVTADGALGASDGGDRNGGGGAGGTIHIVTGTIAGSTGVFGAAGAAGQSPSAKASGGGGGGRIYVGYDTSTFTFSGSVIDASGGAAAGSALGGGDGTALVEDVDDDQVTVFDHFYHSDDDSGEYDNAETWTFDSTSTGECISGTATPDIGKQSVGNVANLTFGGTFTCTETSITNVNFYADTSFALATSTSITVAQKEADIDFTIPDNQTWTNVTITGPEAGRFFIDDAITIELAGTTSVAANPYWENLTGVTIGSSAEIDVSGKGCFDVATDGGSISGTTDGEAYADDGTFTCVKAGTGAGIGAGTGSGGIGSGGGGYGGAGGAGDGRNTDAAGGGTHGSNTAPLRFGSSGGQGSTAEGGYGGGLVYIQQDSGTFTHNGDIIADGAIGEIAEGLPVDERATGGGSGGSIYLNLTATFTGSTGTFSADGADGEENTSFTTYGGGGGGGRVAVLYSSDTSSFLSGLADSTVAVGGTGPSTAVDGSTGSLYTAASSTPPDLTSAVTNDNDGNGQVDQIIATFDIDLNASTIAGSDFTVAGFTVSSASETSAGVVTIIVAESGSVDTDALPLVSVVASVESTDGGELTSDSVTATDAASPVASTFVYKDTDADGDIDRIDITFSENIAYDECEAGDFTFAGADAGSFAVSSCATSGDDLQLTVTGGPSDTTNVTITLAYTASNGTASSLDDSAGSAVADISATAVTDGAAPRSTGTQSYKDTDLDGKVDRVDITFSEDIAIDECEAGDYTIGGADAGTIAVASCAASSADLQLTISNTPSADTLLTFTVAYTAANGTASSLDDSAGNAAVDISALTLADAAAPAITGVTIEDVDTNGLIEKITVTWSENVDTNDSVAPVIADFGTITLPDGQAVSSATISDPAGSSNVVTLTVVAGQVTKNTAAGSTGINGISSEWTDGTNATSNPDDNEVITDSALPVFVSASFKDVTVVDGQVDRVDVTFSEAMTLSSYNTSDWSFPENGDMDLDDTNASASGSDILIVVDGNALTTGSSVTPTVLYTNNANRLTDAASNNVATFGAAEDLDDATAPILRTDGSNAPTYLDNDSNGAIDRVQLTFSESVTVVYSDGDWTATANGLTSFDTGAYLSGNGTTAILLTASAASNLTGVSGGTEPTLAFSASSGSITDGNSLTISSISAKTLVDGAAPVRVSHSYKDVNTDGTIDRFDVTFSEAIAYDECESGDFTVAGGDAGSLAVASCATSSADLQLTMSGGAANDTAIAVTLAYTASNGTASSLDDGTPGNAVGDLSATSLTDLAAPILVSYTYDDDNTDGTVDAVTFIFSEASTLSYTVSDFTVTANGLTSFSLDAGSVTNNGTANVSVPASASSNVTGVSGGTEPTISWSPTGGSISDGSNSISSISSTSATDNTAMILVSQVYKDTNSDGTVNRADLVFSENISLDECDAADYVFAGDDAGTIAVASCAVSTTDLQLTLSNTSANTTSLSITLAYDASEGTADSLKDSTGVVVTDLAAASLSDLAAPVLVSQQYVDSDTDGDIDRFDLTFSEDIAYDECDTADYTIAGSDVGSFAVSACATSNADLRLTVTGGPSNDTYAVLTLAYDASNGTADSLDDSAGNAVGDLTAASLTDGANPIATAKTYTDNSGNGTIDRVVLTLTEAVSLDECETEDFVFSGADAGSIAVVDSTGCSIATNVLTLTLSGAPANTTVLSVSLSYDASQGTADSFKDEGSAVLGDLSYSSLADLAIPIRVSSAYKDVTSVDGVVDRVDVTFSEPMTVSTCEVTDYTFGGADAGSFAVGSCTSSGNDIRYGATGGPSNDTNVTLTFAYDKTNETADSLVDASGNVLASLSAASVSDGAAPMLRTDNGSKSRYLDSDSDGQIDQVQLVFTESVTLTYDDADWTATANDLTSFDVSALESGSGSTTLVLTATAAAGLTGINDGTEPSLAFSDATNLTDGTNPLTSISQALTDGAAPVQSSYNYKDIDGNGTIDRVDVTFTENIDYDECDSGDYSFGGADAGSFAVSACAKSTTDLRLTVTGGVANDTNVTLTLSYDASASTADSLDD